MDEYNASDHMQHHQVSSPPLAAAIVVDVEVDDTIDLQSYSFNSVLSMFLFLIFIIAVPRHARRFRTKSKYNNP